MALSVIAYCHNNYIVVTLKVSPDSEQINKMA